MGVGVEEADGAGAEALVSVVGAVTAADRSDAFFASWDGAVGVCGTHAMATRYVPTPIQISHRFMSSLRPSRYTRVTHVSPVLVYIRANMRFAGTEDVIGLAA
jgi:hypothetical protein